MARINIDDDLYQQMRWFKLLMALKCPDTALGAIVRAWSTAQRFYFPEKLPIPKEIWQSEILSDELINAGFVLETDKGYFVTDSEKRYKWLFTASEKGKKGGTKSAEIKAKLTTGKRKQAQVATGKHKSTTVKPLSPTLSLSPNLSQDIPLDNKYLEALALKPASEKTIEEIVAINKSLNISINPEQVIDLFNSKLAGTGNLGHCRALGSVSLKNMLDSFSVFRTLDDWSQLFERVKQSKQATGEESGVFLATLDWLAVKENALKADAGKYKISNAKRSKNNNFELTNEEINELQMAGEI